MKETLLAGLLFSASAGAVWSAPQEPDILGDLLGAFAAKGDTTGAYCLLYARLQRHPGDRWASRHLARLQRAVALSQERQPAAARGFYLFTAGKRLLARREWAQALSDQRLAEAVRETILRCLLMPDFDRPNA